MSVSSFEYFFLREVHRIIKKKVVQTKWTSQGAKI